MQECYRAVAGVAVVLALLVVWVPRTAAHGEAAQDAFIRTRTVAFYDVQFSGTEIQRGEAVVITGKFFMLKDWPTGVDKPGLAFLTAAVPGPVMLVQERWLNGVFTPGSVTLRQGEEYDFKLILQGRREGRYHVHPMVAVQGSGRSSVRAYGSRSPGEAPWRIRSRSATARRSTSRPLPCRGSPSGTGSRWCWAWPGSSTGSLSPS